MSPLWRGLLDVLSIHQRLLTSFTGRLGIGDRAVGRSGLDSCRICWLRPVLSGSRLRGWRCCCCCCCAGGLGGSRSGGIRSVGCDARSACRAGRLRLILLFRREDGSRCLAGTWLAVNCWMEPVGLAASGEVVVVVVVRTVGSEFSFGPGIYSPRVLVKVWKLVKDYRHWSDLIQPKRLISYMAACWWLINCIRSYWLPVIGAEDSRNAARRNKIIKYVYSHEQKQPQKPFFFSYVRLDVLSFSYKFIFVQHFMFYRKYMFLIRFDPVSQYEYLKITVMFSGKTNTKMWTGLYRPGNLSLKLLSLLVALSEIRGLSIHKVSEAPHVVDLREIKKKN